MSTEIPAAVLCKHNAPPEYLQWPIPQRERGQALIRVIAVPISPLDLLCASGKSYFGVPQLPYIPGVQGIGIVVEADAFAPGQRVWFTCDAGMKPGDGSMALYCTIDESSAIVRFESAILRSRLHTILGYTNNALTHEQKAAALTAILTHAVAGRCTVEREIVPLSQVAEAWQRQAAFARRKLILVP